MSEWDAPRLRARRRAEPSATGVVVSIYLAGWIGGAVFFVLSGPLRLAVQPQGIGGAFAGQFVWIFGAAIASGVVLPHVLESLTGEYDVSYGGSVAAMVAGELVSFAVELAFPHVYFLPLPIGFLVSLGTLPSLFVSYQVLKRLELRAAAANADGAHAIGEKLSIAVPALAVLLLVAFFVFSLVGSALRLSALHLRAHASAPRSESERAIVERLMKTMIRPASAGPNPTAASCRRAGRIAVPAAWFPNVDPIPGDRVHLYDCGLTYASGRRTTECVAFDLNLQAPIGHYVGARGCDGPPLKRGPRRA